jgi:hypothetical protein
VFLIQNVNEGLVQVFFHQFGNMTQIPGIGKFHIILPEIGNLFESLGNKKLHTCTSLISGFKKQMLMMPD